MKELDGEVRQKILDNETIKNKDIKKSSAGASTNAITIIDATGCSMGRLCAIVAKRLRLGERIEVINVEKATVAAKPHVKQRYQDNMERGSRDWGPFQPKLPQMIFRRTVRGMINYKQSRGSDAFKRLKVHIGVPEGMNASKAEVLNDAKTKSTIHGFITVGELSRRLGAKW